MPREDAERPANDLDSDAQCQEKRGRAGAARSRRERFWITCLVATLAVALTPLLWIPWIHGNDGVRNYVYCRSFWIDHDLDFTNEFEHYRRMGEYELDRIDPLTGRPGNALGIGSSILWSPFFWAAHLLAKAVGAPEDGYSAPYAWAICFGSTLYAIVGLILLTRVALRRFEPQAVLVGVLGVWLGSPLAFYMYLHPSMSHSCSFFLCSLLVWLYERWKRRVQLAHFFAIGFVGGLAAVTRFNDAVFLLLVLAFWLRAVRLSRAFMDRHPARRGVALWAGILAGAGVLLAMAPQFAAWRYFYGAWLAGPRDYALGRNLRLWSSPYLYDLLFSGWRGMLVWSPVLFLAIVGFGLLLRHGRLLDAALAVMFVIQVWIIGGWEMWWGGASFGQRFFINLTPAFAMGLAWLFLSLRPGAPRRLLVALVVGCVLWSGGLAVQYVARLIPREEPVTLAQLTRNQVREAPQWVFRHVVLFIPGFRTTPHGDDEGQLRQMQRREREGGTQQHGARSGEP